MQPASPVVSRLPPTSPAGKKPRPSWIVVMLALGLGGIIGFFGVYCGKNLLMTLPGPKALGLVDILLLPLTWLVAVGFHEFGHIMGGWLTGGRFLLWIAGPFMVKRTPAGLVAGWNPSVNLMGGLGACLPLDPARITPRRASIMIVGGPIASLVLAAAAYGLASFLAGEPTSGITRALIQHAVVFSGALSLLIFFATVVPAENGGFKSDGKRVIDLLRGDHRSAQEAALLIVSTAGLAGIRPADLDRDLIQRVISLRDGSLFDLYGHLMVFYHDADRGDFGSAQARLDYALAGEMHLVPYMRQTIRCEYAWLLATRTNDAKLARAWLESAGTLAFDPATRLRAEASVLLAEGRKADAAERVRDALHALEHKSLSPVKNPFASDALNALLQQIGNT